MLESYFYIGSIVLLGAVLLDLLMGDPRWLPHPVVQMGKLITSLDKSWNKGSYKKQKGVLLATTVVITVYALTFAIVFVAHQLSFWAGLAVEIYLVSTTIAIKGLSDAGKNVLKPLLTGNIGEARKSLSMIVGRDTETLSECEVVRGTVETVAENTVDGITAPLFWALIGGAPLAMAYRAINTLDSMVGYKSEKYLQFGWASARLDDLANFLPARLTALTMWFMSIFIKNSKRKTAWMITWRDARKHPSPNSGWPEAMTAGLMGIQLGGINYYRGVKSDRARMGDPMRELAIADITTSIRYMHGGWIGFLLVGLFLLFLWTEGIT
ncbi:adenosylcobinamide-phosphate synthase CbiB [Sutcliffiella rhizosphaerae]|uniref:Cobalamin biosynthesis protein CobD n=1 Tax=Sutcliffiella rhizosphaerae TaxID=2880967 RepID=A0ABN8A544_9BACI|nr:adenosylcobinamide-phosphate synthase CbiB [Sutcliffiella rhizosphaerae]CAG9620233.1 Cobalamin biosynthesis protein CobD [Sutcliffiella rhizosphaerae]